MAKAFRLLLDTLVQTNGITWSSDDWRVRWSLACRQRFPGMKIFGCHQGLCICDSIVILNLMFLFQHPSNLRFISLLELLFAQRKFLFALANYRSSALRRKNRRGAHIGDNISTEEVDWTFEESDRREEDWLWTSEGETKRLFFAYQLKLIT